MRLDASAGLRGKFYDAVGGSPVRWVRWYDDATHEFEAYSEDPAAAKHRAIVAGLPAWRVAALLHGLLYRGRRPLRFVPAAPAPRPKAGGTPLEEIREEVLRGRVVEVKPVLAFPGVKPPECEAPLCHRPATWQTAHERLVEPERGEDGRLYERAVVTETHVWCDWCYRPPVQVSERGVASEVEVSARPQ